MARAVTAATIITAVLAIAPAARAQEHPMFLPDRDVAVTYQLSSGSAGGQTTHLYFSSSANALRIDTPNNAGFTVLDRTAGRRVMVMNDQSAYAAVPLDPGTDTGFVLNSSMTYRRQGPGSVADIACTRWSVTSPQVTGEACVTEDGVLLSGSGRQLGGGADTSLTATSVDYAPQPASLFQPPAGFRKLDPSQIPMPPGSGGAPNGPGNGPDAGPGNGNGGGGPGQ